MLHPGDRHGRGARGAVTAEIALGLPLLLALTVALVWLLVVGVAQVRVVDAAREGARMMARGDTVADATARAREVAPTGAEVDVGRSGGDVVVRVEARVEGPGGLLGHLPGATVHARATAVAE